MKPVTPYLRTLVKAYVTALHTPHASDQAISFELIRQSRVEGITTGQAIMAVAIANVAAMVELSPATASEYRILVFDDETAVVSGPEGASDKVYALWRDTKLFVEAHLDAPHWLTPKVVDALSNASHYERRFG